MNNYELRNKNFINLKLIKNLKLKIENFQNGKYRYKLAELAIPSMEAAFLWQINKFYQKPTLQIWRVIF